MYRYIKGYIDEIGDSFLVVENNGIGYKINTSMSSISSVNKEQEYKIYTYLHVREDDISIYGFISKQELSLFLNLISVSKIGPKVGLGILSSMDVSEIKEAIVNEDPITLSKAPGVGKKTANRMILELKDKIKDNIIVDTQSKEVKKTSYTGEAVDALVALGYTKYEASNVISKLKIDNKNTEEIIKTALLELSK